MVDLTQPEPQKIDPTWVKIFWPESITRLYGYKLQQLQATFDPS